MSDTGTTSTIQVGVPYILVFSPAAKIKSKSQTLVEKQGESEID